MTSTNNSAGRNAPSGLMALKKIIEGLSDLTGEAFFRVLVKNLAEVLNVHGVWVTEYLRESNRLRALAFWLNDHYVDHYEYDVPGTPCEPVLHSRDLCHIPDRVIELYPLDPDLPPLGAVSYMGIAMKDAKGQVLGHLALLDNKPMDELPEMFAIFKIFAARATAEMRRLQYERKLIDNDLKLTRLFNGTLDALIEINDRWVITQANDAARKSFENRNFSLIGSHVSKLFEPLSFKKIHGSIGNSNNTQLHQSLFIKNITCMPPEGKAFPAELSISGYQVEGGRFYALFLRNISDKVEFQKEIKLLHTETEILREMVQVNSIDEIIGESPAILRARKAVQQVARTDSTVLIRGETGTGKELFARAIHRASNRKHKPMITLNCAALPYELVESELFGHVKGAFTGASGTREGRFSLANGGTIFLDEIGELSLNLQAKLLRVLQEGEFEPVGSSKTQKVDVRVIAATNRDMEHDIESGQFRADLYYRLNVFPIDVPPLRERRKDILLIAEAFLEKYAKQAALQAVHLDDYVKNQLMEYHWPGNVRELQNIMERCVITASNGKINLAACLPAARTMEIKQEPGQARVLKESEMIELEKQNIIRALEACDWKVSGDDGAAALLQIPSTTLSSRCRKYGIYKALVKG